TGLGLASAYGIIKNHGGIISVISTKGVGTTFNIYLPASEKPVTKDKIVDEGLLMGTETILLVDDEEMIIDVGMDILKIIGYKVLVARGGQEAIEIYKKNEEQVDLIILDMIMPDMSGPETCRILREIKTDLKIIFSSGYSMNGNVKDIMNEGGCAGFIQKPYKVRELSQKIREVLGMKMG
ncbi:MAG: response regulator, partial [Thermodesulfobacteriota bacterium]|nr:response regulator [Thermodesulfobacteriota bacterium]